MNDTARQRSPGRASRPHRFARRMIPVLILGLAGLAIWLLPAFRLQQLHLPDQLRSVTRQQLLQACELEAGRHLFRELGGSVRLWVNLRYGAVEDRILSRIPAVKEATVYLDFPGSITCVVTERIEVAWLAIPDGCVMVDQEGVALNITSERPDDIPVIEGISVRSMTLGRPLEVDSAEAMNHAISLLGAIIEADRDPRPGTALLSQVIRIRPIGGRQLYLTLRVPDTGEALTVLDEMQADLAEDMLWLRFALDQDALNGRGKGILDLTGNRKTFIPDS